MVAETITVLTIALITVLKPTLHAAPMIISLRVVGVDVNSDIEEKKSFKGVLLIPDTLLSKLL
jgi:hypothetical protein